MQSAPLTTAPDTRCHEAVFYSDERSVPDDFAQSAEAALRAGGSLVTVLHDSRRHQLNQALRARGVDLDRAAQQPPRVA